MKKRYPVVVFIFLFCLSLRGDDFFEIKSVKFYKEENPSGAEITKIVEEEEGKRVLVRQEFIEVRVSAKKRTRFDSVFAKVYFMIQTENIWSLRLHPILQPDWEKENIRFPHFLMEEKLRACFSLCLKKSINIRIGMPSPFLATIME